MAGQDFEEKRNYFRMRVNGPVQIKRPDSTESFHAEGLDLSASGLSLIADEMVSEGEILDISIKVIIRSWLILLHRLKWSELNLPTNKLDVSTFH